MFGRNTNSNGVGTHAQTPASTGAAPPANNASSNHSAPPQTPPSVTPSVSNEQPTFGRPNPNSSVIGNDLTIIGQAITIVSQGHVQIDGAVQGNVHGKQVSIGQRGSITGTVMAETVEVRGQLMGSIRSPSVTLHPTAQVEGDIHHQLLAISEGAIFDGRVRRPADPSELTPNLDVAAITESAGPNVQVGTPPSSLSAAATNQTASANTAPASPLTKTAQENTSAPQQAGGVLTPPSPLNSIASNGSANS